LYPKENLFKRLKMDDTKSLEEMKKKKDEFQIKANELKKKRDELHLQSKRLAGERDELNSKIRELRNKIGEHKRRRDEFNERVKHAKEQRNEVNKKLIAVKKRIKDLEKQRELRVGVNLNRLKQNLRKLENEQMTQPMSSQKEKKLIETIAELHKQIREQEELLNKDPRLKEALEEEKILRQKAEKQHELVEKLAKRAQEEHQNMIDLLKSVDNMVRRVNEIQEKIVMTKIEADKIHREFIDHVNKIHELERQITKIESKQRRKKKLAEVTTTQKEAIDIFERFKRGEKLSTEDLMILQKAGLL